MKIERVHVYGFQTALRAMRNPMDSWDKSDTIFGAVESPYDPEITCVERPLIGPRDFKLACKLIKGGSVHRKFMRQIGVTWDNTLPRYIHQELDTYKVATVRNSCSTMHKLGHRDLVPSDFQDGDVHPVVLAEQNDMGYAYRNKETYTERAPAMPAFPVESPDMVTSGEELEYEGNALLARMKRRLPEGFLQMATYTFNYETALGMYQWRHNHRMSEWSGPDGICAWLLRLPYFSDFFNAARAKPSDAT